MLSGTARRQSARLRGLLRRHGPAGDDPRSREYGVCDFCGTRRAKTVEFSYIADHIVDRAGAFYGSAVEQLPYDSGEGGWQGGNFDSYDLVQDEIGLDLPRDSSGELFQAVVDALG